MRKTPMVESIFSLARIISGSRANSRDEMNMRTFWLITKTGLLGIPYKPNSLDKFIAFLGWSPKVMNESERKAFRAKMKNK
jgi:hypothetical protein